MKNLHAKRVWKRGGRGKKVRRRRRGRKVKRKRNESGEILGMHPEEDVRIFEQLDTYNFTDIRRSCESIFYAKELKT